MGFGAPSPRDSRAGIGPGLYHGGTYQAHSLHRGSFPGNENGGGGTPVLLSVPCSLGYVTGTFLETVCCRVGM